MGNFLDYYNKKKGEGKTSSSSGAVDFRKYTLEKSIGLDTFENDLKELGTTVGSIYGGWQTQETMQNTRGSVEAMQKRIDAYQKYQSKYGGTDLSDIARGYKSVLEDWDTLTSVYSNYQNADAYKNAVNKTKFDKDFAGLTYDEVQAKKKEYGLGTDEYSYLDSYTGYSNSDDFEKAISTDSSSKVKDKLTEAKNLYDLDHAGDKYLDILKNEDFAEKSQYKSTKKDDAKWWQSDIGDETYEYINNVDGIRSDILAEHDKYQAMSQGGIYTPSQYSEMGVDAMTDEEIGIYNYIYATEGKDSANKYLEDIKIVLNKRLSDEKADSIKNEVDGSAGASIALSLASPILNVGGAIYSGIDSLGSIGKEKNPYGPYNSLTNMAGTIRGEVSENIAENTDWEIGGVNVPSFLYNTGMSMADSALGAFSLGKAYTPLMGMSAYQQTAKELTEAGASDDEVVLTALISGIAEAGFEYAGIDNLFKTKGSDSIKSIFKNTLKQMGAEATEETFTEITNIIADTWVRGGNSEYQKMYDDLINRGFSAQEAQTQIAKDIGSRVAQAGIGGALSGGVMGGVFSTVQHHDLSNTGKELKANDRTQDIMDMFTPEEAEAYEVYSEYASKGVNAGNITDAQLGNLYATKETGAVDTLKSKKATAEQKIGAVKTLDALDTYRSTPSTKVKATGEKVDIKGMKEVDGKTVLETSSGDMAMNDVQLSSKHKELLSYAEEMSEEKKNLFVSQYDGTSDVESYKNSFDMAYTYGEVGFGADSVLKNRGILTEAQASTIYKEAITNKVAVQQKAIEEINAKYGKAVTVAGKFDDSIIDYNSTTKDGSKVNWNSLTTNQRNAITLVKGFSEATGVNITFIKSDVVNGKRVGKNGSYNPETNTIELDVYAGRVDASALNDSIIPTLSHEMTHWMKAKSPAMYSKMREYISETLAIDGKLTSEERVAQEMARIKKNHPDIEVTEDMAIDEIMARACEDMLSNSDTARKMLNRLSKKEQSSFIAKVKETFNNLMQWVNDLLGQYKSTSKEAETLRQYRDRLKQLSKMWDEALTEAVQTNQSLQKEGKTAEHGETKYSSRNNNYSAYPLNRKYAKIDRGDKVSDEEWEVAGHAIFAEAVKRKQNGETLAYDGEVTSSNHIFYFTHFDDADIVPQVYMVKKIDSNKTGGISNVIKKRRANSKSVVGQRDGRENHSGSDTRNGHRGQTGQDDTLLADRSGIDEGQSNVTSEGDISGNGEIRQFSDRDAEYQSLSSEVEEYRKQHRTATQELKKYQLPEIDYKAEDVDAEIAKYKKWEDESGYGEAYKLANELKDKLRNAERKLQNLADELRQEMFTSFTEEDVKKYVGKAVRRYHTTSMLSKASYLTTTGSMLDFSDGQRYRVKDHREISEILDLPDYAEYSDGMIVFMNMGNIRLQEYGVDISAMPNSKQITALRNIIYKVMNDNDEFYLDVSDHRGNNVFSMTYGAKTSATKIISDIQNYFKDGTIPEQQSSLRDFYYSDRDSDGTQLTDEQIEYFKNSKIRDDEGNLKAMYHGTPNGDFTVFRDGTYFTENKAYADIYQNQGASSLGYKKTSNAPKTYKVYLNIEKPFDTRNAKERAIFKNEYFGQWGMGTPLMESGLPDWMDGEDLREFLLEKGYDYDGLILDEGAVGGYGDEVKSRGLSYVIFNSNQVKNVDNLNPTDNDDIRYADREDVSIYDLMGENEALQKENAELKEDVARLNERLKLEKQLTNGNTFNANQLDSVAGHLRKISNSSYSKAKLVEELRDVYTYIVTSEQVDWTDLMAKCSEVARNVLNESKGYKITDEYYKSVLSDLRSARIALNDEQIQEAKHAYGERYRDAFMGRIVLAKNGTMLDQKWAEWSAMYPEIFDANISPADQITELSSIYDALREGAESYQQYLDAESIRAFAVEIYNQYWNVSTIRTTADRHDKEIKRLNYEHRKAVGKVRAKYKEKLENQKLADTIHYGKKISKLNQKLEAEEERVKKRGEMIKAIRQRKDAEVKQAKELGKQKLEGYKDRVAKEAKIKNINKNIKTLKEYLDVNSKEKHINEELKPVVRSLVQAIDYELGKSEMAVFADTGLDLSPTMLEELKIRDTAEAVANVRNEMKFLESLYKMKTSLDSVEFYGLGIEGELDNLITHLENLKESNQYPKMVLHAMSLDQLKTVDKLVRAMKTVVNQANKLHTIKRNMGIDEIGMQITSFLDKLGLGKVYKGALGKYSKVFNWLNLVPYYAFNRLGEGGKILFGSLQDGWDKMAFNIKTIFDFANETYSKEDVKNWSKDIKTITIGDDTFKMTATQIMSLYCLYNREQGKRHILKEGITVSDFEDGGLELVHQPKSIKLTGEGVEQILSELSNEQLEVAQKIQEFMNTVCSEWGNYVSMERFGYRAFEEENYFPIEVDDTSHSKDKITDNKNTSLYALLNMGFTKSINENSTNPIMVKDIFDVFANHASEMAKYNALGLAVLDFNRVMNYSEQREDERYSIRKAMEVAYGKDAEMYFNKLIADLNGTQSVSRDILGKTMMSRAKLGAISLNMKTVLLQPTAYFKASAILGRRYLYNPVVSRPDLVKRGTERAKKYCGITLWKSMGFYDTNISRGVVEQIKHEGSLMDDLAEKSTALMEKADEITFGALWNACELEVKDAQRNLKVGSEEFYKAVAVRLREVIYATQVVDSTLTRSEMMRSGDKWDNMLTSFGSEPTLAYNMLLDCVSRHQILKRGKASEEELKENRHKTARVLEAYVVTNVVVALLETFVTSFRDDDELEEEEIIGMLLENFASNMGIIGKIPYLKDLLNIFRGYSPSRFDTQGAQSLYYAITGIQKNLEGKGNPVTTMKNLLKAYSSFSGIGIFNAYRDVMALLHNLNILTAEELEELLGDIIE